MAARSLRDKKVKEVIECPICLETIEKSKCLPCAHTFCLQCLEKQSATQELLPRDEMQCPVCRQEFKIPSRGFEEFSPNNVVEELIDIFNQALNEEVTKKQSLVRCTGCNKNIATKLCAECSQNMCEDCSMSHLDSFESNAHTVSELKETRRFRALSKSLKTYCPVHELKQKLYCCACNQGVCIRCSTAEHATHLCVDIQAPATQFSERSLSEVNKDFDNRIANKSEENSMEETQGQPLSASGGSCGFRGKHQIHTTRDDPTRPPSPRLYSSMRYFTQLCVSETGEKEDGAISRSAEPSRHAITNISQSQDDMHYSSTDGVSCWSADTQDTIVVRSRFSSTTTLQDCQEESIFVAVGLDAGFRSNQRACHVSLERENSVGITHPPPTWIPAEATACVIGNTLYVVGLGCVGKELWTWNETSDWVQCEDMEQGRQKHSVAAVDSTLFVMGGFTDKTTLGSVFSYNTQNNAWSAAGIMTHAVRSAACLAYQNSVYVFGGKDQDNERVNHVQKYSTAPRACSLLLNAMPEAYSLMRAVLWETSAILLGKYASFIYGFESMTWQKRENFKTRVWYFGAVVNNGDLYVIGGRKNTVEEGGMLIFECIDTVRRVAVRDVMEGTQGAEWTRHATLPQSAMIQIFSPVPLSIKRDATDNML